MIAVSPTDHDWFMQLRDGLDHDQVNFWTPTPWNIRQLTAGDWFYFLLKAPIRKLAGYGTFALYENMSASQAWRRFGTGNGVQSLAELVARTTKYAGQHSNSFELTDDPIIGCIILNNPIFWDEKEFVAPEDAGLPFPREVVKVKYFEAPSAIAFPSASPDASSSQVTPAPFDLVDSEGKNYRATRVGERVGKSIFRHNVLEAYEYQCAISGETCREVLEAAHIQPYVNEQSNDVRNGLALRSDIHRLFDAGLITIGMDHRVLVSDYLDSSEYRSLAGREMRLPTNPQQRPASNALNFHQRLVFRGARK